MTPCNSGKPSPRTFEADSSMTRHCFHAGHSFAAVQTSLLSPCENGPRLNRLEEIYTLYFVSESNKSGFNVLNDMNAVFFNHTVRYMLD